jgi:hypothetical protein
MSRRSPKTSIVAFKVEEELAEILDQLPNKSEFIRKAIVAQLSMACPLCRGTGVLPRGLHDHYAPLLEKLASRACDGCGDELPVPRDSGELAPADRQRLEQFFFGGPLYCNRCYQKAPACDDCGWHIVPSQKPAHQHAVHAN